MHVAFSLLKDESTFIQELFGRLRSFTSESLKLYSWASFSGLKDLECYGFESRPKLEADCDKWLKILHVMHDFF